MKHSGLQNKVAIVTGGAGVLCSSFAHTLAQYGVKVAVADYALDKAEMVAKDIQQTGGTAMAVGMNVLDMQSINAANEEVKAAFGPCDILINGAGGNHPSATSDDEYFSMETLNDPAKKSFFDLDPTAFEKVMGLNLTGTFMPTQVIARDMAAKQSGVILNITSMNAYRPLTKIPAYSAAKAGVSNLTQWLAVHFAKSGIRVNAIAPGFFSTAQNKALLWNADGSATARTEKILNATPMGRFGEPEELLGAMLFLVDDEQSAFVTGIAIPVDGGFSAYSGV